MSLRLSTAPHIRSPKTTTRLMLNVLLLIVGCFFDTSAAILILAPMLLPTAAALGIRTLHETTGSDWLSRL